MSGESPVLGAKDVYVLLHPHVRVSRNVRAQWLLRHLQPNWSLKIKKFETSDALDGELGAVGAVPDDSCMPEDWDWDVAHLYRYQITPATTVRFISQRYRMVYLLDLSPSSATVSTSQSATAVERLVPALRNTLEGVVRPFYVPGSQLLLKPDLYVTVIAWTPFLTSDTQLVLHQGWPLTQDNLTALIDSVISKLHRLEERVAHVNSAVQADLISTRAEADRLMGGLFEASPPPPACPSTPVATSDAGFVNMIKTGALALQLLPKNSSAGLYVVGDGSLTLPDIEVCDILLNQLRTKTVSLSFLQVTSANMPQSGLSRVPYNDFLNFISCSTYGSYLPQCPPVRTADYVYDMNLYHESFFCWSFKKALQGVRINPRKCDGYLSHAALSATGNSFFQCDSDSEDEDDEEDEEDDKESVDEADDAPDIEEEDEGWEDGVVGNLLLRRRGENDANIDDDINVKQNWEGELCSSLVSILSCRLREGYTVNEVRISLEENTIEVKLSLPWKISSLIHYLVIAPWPIQATKNQSELKSKIFVFLEGDYDTVHDIVCGSKREEQGVEVFRSAERASVVQKFFTTIQHLTRVDKLLVHLDSFSSNPANYQVPESVSNGIPLFQVPSVHQQGHDPSASVDLQTKFPNSPFAAFWRPVCCLDINIWHRWLHTHRVNIVLNHDSPLPKHFVTPNSSGRYTNVQCRKAAAKICHLLKEESSFTMVENVSYIKFLYEDDSSHKEPSSFFVLRVTSKPPCVVLWLAFPGGTDGCVRYRELDKLKAKLRRLTIKQHIHWRDPNSTFSSSTHRFRAIISNEESLEQPAVEITVKPVEKILVRYEQVPRDFFNLLEPAYYSSSRSASPDFGRSRHSTAVNPTNLKQMNGGVFLTLARYLAHERWIWSLQQQQMLPGDSSSMPLSPSAMVRIHSTLVRTRLLQGFNFAHSKNGIQTMVREFKVKDDDTRSAAATGGVKEYLKTHHHQHHQSMLAQYVLFPPHRLAMAICDMPDDDFYLGGDDEDGFGEEEEEEKDSGQDLITEVWIEPQDGVIVTAANESKDFGGMHAKDISRLIYHQDKEVVTTMLSLEYLCAMCRDTAIENTALLPLQATAESSSRRRHRASAVHNHGDPGSILPPPQQTGTICQVPFNFDLLSMLDKTTHTEVLFSTFIQEILVDIPIEEGNAVSIQHFYHENDKSNERLVETFHLEAGKLHDREVAFSDADYAAFIEHIRKRNAKNESAVRITDKKAKFVGGGSGGGGGGVTGAREPHSSSRMVSGASSSNVSDAATSIVSKDSHNLQQQQTASASASGQSAKWRCYAKAVTSSDVLLTFIPSSFQDLKLLLLDDEAMMGKSNKTLDVIKQQAARADRAMHGHDELLGEKNKDGLMVDPLPNDTPPRSGTESGSSMRARAGSLSSSHTALLSQQQQQKQQQQLMRKRTQSIDSTAISMGMERSRCKSMESENMAGLDQQATNSSHPIDPKGKLRARTHTYSYVHNRSRGGLMNKLKNVSDQQQQQESPGRRKKSNPIVQGVLKKSVHGSLTLPVYCYCCSESDLTAFLLKVGKEMRPNGTVDVTFRPEERETEKIHIPPDPESLAADRPSSPSSTPHPMDSIRSTFNGAVQKSFFSAFVYTVFQSLQHNLPIHDFDVQHCIDYCDTETILDTDMSSFLRSVCNHAKSSAEETDKDDSRVTILNCAALRKYKSCVDSDLNHTVMKKKFKDMLLTSFQQVPSVKDLYFFRPAANSSRAGFGGPPINTTAPPRGSVFRQRRDTKDTTTSSSANLEDDLIEFRSSGEKGQRGEAHAAGIGQTRSNSFSDAPGTPAAINHLRGTANNHSSLSLISNMTSEQDQDDSCGLLPDPDVDDDERENDDDSSPLFLQVSVTVKYGRECLKNISISRLLTCFVDLLKEHDYGSIESMDLDKLCVTLDFICITLPLQNDLAVLENQLIMRSSSIEGDYRDLWKKAEDEDDAAQEDVCDEVDPLSKVQRKAVVALVDEIRWILEDEIIFAQTRSREISKELVEKVVVHIGRSSGKPGSSIQSIPLNFVFGHDPSFELFSQDFELIQVPHFTPVRSGEYVYFVQAASLPVAAAAGGAGIGLEVDPSDKDRKQLSPVREVIILPAGETMHSSLTLKERPMFWLAMKVNADRVDLYFQYREGQLSAVLPWRTAQHQIAQEVDAVMKKVNQIMLLKSLHDTRCCNPLLEEQEDESVFNVSQEEVPYFLEANLFSKYSPGTFSCGRVWETRFHLHPRLIIGPDSVSSKGVSSISATLNVFAVSNRKNMFVFQDEKKDVFYLRLHEHASLVSRQSSFARNFFEDGGGGDVGGSRTSSFGSAASFKMNISGDDGNRLTAKTMACDYIELKAFGVSEPGLNLTKELVAVLQYKLDERVVEILSTILQRNPMSKLGPDDVAFLQKPDSQPSNHFKYALSKKVRPYLCALRFYLKQNMTCNALFTLPKYASSNPEHHFHNIAQSATSSRSDGRVYLFNNASRGGHRGIAIVAISIVDKEGNLLEDETESDVSLAEMDRANRRRILTEAVRVRDGETPKLGKIFIDFHVWESGRVEPEDLDSKLSSCVRHSLWDLTTEFGFLRFPISVQQLRLGGGGAPGSTSRLHPAYERLSREWFAFGLDVKANSCRSHEAVILTRFSLTLMLKEVVKMMSKQLPDMETLIFHRPGGKPANCYFQIETVGSVHSSFPLRDEFLVFVRPPQSESGGDVEDVKKSVHGLLRFKPRQAAAAPRTLLGADAGSPPIQSPPQLYNTHPHPSASSMESSDDSSSGHVGHHFPRSCFLVVRITTETVLLHYYNFCSEGLERINKQTTNLTCWLSARAALAASIAAQKCGMFHRQVILRKQSNVNVNQFDLLVKNSAPPPPPTSSSPNSRHGGKSGKAASTTEAVFKFAYRDNKPETPLQESRHLRGRDMTGKLGRQLLDVTDHRMREILGRLTKLWQSKADSNQSTLTKKVMQQFMSMARIIHFCLTPMLFLPKWRYQAHSTRQRYSVETETLAVIPSLSQFDQQLVKKIRKHAQDESDHEMLIEHFLQDYITYIQTVGFIVLKVEDVDRRPLEPIYLQKSLPGGMLIYEIGVSEPFIYNKLLAVEFTRFSLKRNQFYPQHTALTTGLVDECDRLRFLIHLHSFTFDYHLRLANSYVAERPHLLRKDFHFTSFLADFLMYYSKGPNFARNLMCCGTMEMMTNEKVSPDQLYNYLLCHEKSYDLKVLRMEPLFVSDVAEFQCEYILAREGQCRLTFTNGKTGAKKTDEYDVNLVIEQVGSDELEGDGSEPRSDLLKLRYFVVFTSKRELYPAYYWSKQQGEFRPVVTNYAKTKLRNNSSSSSLREVLSGENSPTKTAMDSADEDNSVYYVGYYSQHEQSMQEVMRQQKSSVEETLFLVLKSATVHCRRDQLWQKLYSPKSGFDFSDLMEMADLVSVNDVFTTGLSMSSTISSLSVFKGRYQSLVRCLSTKFSATTGCCCRLFQSSNGDSEFLLIMDEKVISACVVLCAEREQGGQLNLVLNLLSKEDLQSGNQDSRTFVRAVLENMAFHDWVDNVAV